MSAYDSIASATITDALSEITFNNLPQNYTDLFINIRPVVNTGTYDVKMWFNGDRGAGVYYWDAGWSSVSAGVGFNRFTAQTVLGTNWYGGSTATGVTNQQVYIPNYTNNNTVKHIWVQASQVGNSSAGVDSIIGHYTRTNAITSITLSFSSAVTFVSPTTVDIYGVGAGTPKAEGGSLVTNDGTYWYHAFTGSGTFTPRQALSADVLVIAGGGGGGMQYGGGGGAGGVAYQAGRSLLAQNYTVTVGAGGFTNMYSGFGTSGASGSNSTFDTITANGGGGGGGWDGTGRNGTAGGSGGGGSMGTSSNSSTNGGATTQGSSGGATGYGFAGGGGQRSVSPGTNFVGGGGGGAGGAGSNGNSQNNGGAGGAGLNTWSSWLTALNLGVSGFIAGGGGGSTGIQGGGTAGGAGGSGGGATGTLGGVGATQAVINTGSGGGGGYEGYNGGGGPGSNGASGLVIVRYAV